VYCLEVFHEYFICKKSRGPSGAAQNGMAGRTQPMTGAFVVAPEAEDDVFQIWSYLLVEVGISTANRIEGEILNAFSGLARVPGKGHRGRT
jgi:hypothetical protein